MSFSSLYRGTEIVDVGNGYWVEIKQNLTADEKDQADAFLQKVEGVMDESGKVRGVVSPDYAAYRHEILFASIVSWNLDDDDRRLWPLEPDIVRRASIRRLPETVRDLLFARATELNKAPDAQSDRTFHDDAPGRDSDGDTRSAGTATVSDGSEVVGEAGNTGRTPA